MAAKKKALAKKTAKPTTTTKTSVPRASSSKASVSKKTASKAPRSKAAASKAPRSETAASEAPRSETAASEAPRSKTAASKTPRSKTAASKTAVSNAKASATKTRQPNAVTTKKPRVFAIPFASIYPLYVQKAEKKGRTRLEVEEVIAWLTGYRGKALARAIDAKVDLETFFAQAPRMNPNANLITGVVCGVRVEDVADPLMQKIRYLDKLVDELAKGKKLANILRQ